MYLIAFIIGDWTAPLIQKTYDMQGVAFIHATCGICVPIGIAVNALIGAIPGLRDINLSQEKIVAKLGILGEPVTLATILGVGLGLLACWSGGQCCVLAVKLPANMQSTELVHCTLQNKMLELTYNKESILKLK